MYALLCNITVPIHPDAAPTGSGKSRRRTRPEKVPSQSIREAHHRHQPPPSPLLQQQPKPTHERPRQLSSPNTTTTTPEQTTTQPTNQQCPLSPSAPASQSQPSSYDLPPLLPPFHLDLTAPNTLRQTTRRNTRKANHATPHTGQSRPRSMASLARRRGRPRQGLLQGRL
jgi:hypothetical protein